jgi:dUTPase
MGRALPPASIYTPASTNPWCCGRRRRRCLISAGIAFRIGDPEWCALVLPRSGQGHRDGLVLGNAVGVIDADYEGACLISAWNRNPARAGPLRAGN